MFDVQSLLAAGGLLLFGIIIFAEVGLFLGFFLPGDTLVIAAGIYAHQGKFSIASVLAVCAVAAIAGDSLGYYIGRRLGPSVFNREDSIIFRPDHVKRAHDFFEKY
ncbi:MAG: DedA family protein, partial [Candidatus Saccharimonadales bacterium]